MHTDIRWLSRGKFLHRFRDLIINYYFINLINDIKQFLSERGDDYKQLNNDIWLLDLEFLTDITAKLNDLNLELQCLNKTTFHMISAVTALL